MERPVGKDPLERSDGKDPFDFRTYYAENGLTITTMIDFRTFCAAFFQTYIRTNTSTEDFPTNKFIKLITCAEVLFKRARAVIPELQVPQEQSFHDNANVRQVLLASRELRGSSTKRWSNQPEELAWLKLISEGGVLADKQEKEKQALDASGQTSPNVATSDENIKQASNASIPASPSVTTGSQRIQQPSNGSIPASPSVITEHGPEKQVSGASAQANTDAKSKDEAGASEPKTKSKFEDVPTFVPRSALGNQETVWSPTRGSRLRRPDETYQAPVASSTPMNFGQTLTPTYGTPPSQFLQYQTTQHQALMPGMIDNLTSRSRTLHNRTSSNDNPKWSPMAHMAMNRASFDLSTRGHAPPHKGGYTRKTPIPFHEPVKQGYEPRRQANRPPPISPITNMGGPRYPVNRTHGIPGVEPFSAPPSVQHFQGRHYFGQGAYGGPVVPFQTPQSRYLYNPIVNTTDSGPMTPMARTWDIPPPGSMPPVAYWDMLYQREHELRTTLAKSHSPPTEEVLHYFARLEQARLTAVATNLPNRGNAGKGQWLNVLQKEMNGIWNAQPRSMPFSPVIIARKQDYEKVIYEAIRAANMET